MAPKTRTPSDPTQQPGFETKDVSVVGLKVVDEDQGIVEAYVAGIGNLDDGGDIIEPGFFQGALKKRKPKGVWSHNWSDTIAKTLDTYEVKAGDGRLSGTKLAEAGAGGQYVKMQFNLETQRGREAFADVKFFGDEQEWSIGYKVTKSTRDDKGNRHLVEGEWFEYSPVLAGMNAATSTVSAKGALVAAAVGAGRLSQVEEKVYIELEGSYELLQTRLRKALRAWAKDTFGPQYGYSVYCSYEATFADSIVFELFDWTDGGSQTGYYRLPYTSDENGVQLGEQATPVSIAAVASDDAVLEEAGVPDWVAELKGHAAPDSALVLTDSSGAAWSFTVGTPVAHTAPERKTDEEATETEDEEQPPAATVEEPPADEPETPAADEPIPATVLQELEQLAG